MSHPSVTETRIAELAAHVSEWACAHGLFAGLTNEQQAAKARVIATFVVFCSPERPSAWGQQLAAHITAVFFYLDDLPREWVEPEAVKLLHVLTSPDSRGQGEYSGPQLALIEYLSQVEQVDEAGHYRRELGSLFRAMIAEARRIQLGPWTLSDFEEYRLNVIFVREYVWSWLLSERISLNDMALAECEPLLRWASEIVAIVNDLASVSRERALGGTDPNLVLLIENQGSSPEEALDYVVNRHETLGNLYADLMNKLLISSTPAVPAIATVIDFVVRGNFLATVTLSRLRYPEAVDVLRRLRLYDENYTMSLDKMR